MRKEFCERRILAPSAVAHATLSLSCRSHPHGSHFFGDRIFLLLNRNFLLHEKRAVDFATAQLFETDFKIGTLKGEPFCCVEKESFHI